MARGGIVTPIGTLTVTTSRVGVCRVDFGSIVSSLIVDEGSDAALEHLDLALTQLGEYFGAGRRSFSVSIDRSGRTGFRGEVQSILESVGYGELVTYGQLAARAGRPRASRAVGSAMAANPVPVLVPCHRVIRTGGVVGNYAGGAAAKVWLLSMEAGD